MLTVSTSSTAKKCPQTEAGIDLAGKFLTIRKGGKVECYAIDEFPTSFDGRAFELVKQSTGERYNVFVANNPQDHHCDCLGHEAKGYCKHVDALLELWQAGWLEDPRAGDPRPEEEAPEQLAGPDPFDREAAEEQQERQDYEEWSERIEARLAELEFDAQQRREHLYRIAVFGLSDAEQAELAALERLTAA
jgi:hypothetical protein